MSGHSKWHNIRLRKGAQDAKRGNLFTKLAKEIIMAAKAGGGVPETNLRLRLAIQRARENSMPQDNIKRSIQRGTGEIEGAMYDEVTYEGYGPAGCAIIVECATDNRNRTVANLRNIFVKNGGNMGESGSVSFRFQTVGLISIPRDKTDEDTLFALVTEAGAEDLRVEDDQFVVVTQPEDFGSVKDAIEDAKIAVSSANITLEPLDTVRLESKDAAQVLRLMERLEEDDDVQNVYANFDIPDEILDSLSV